MKILLKESFLPNSIHFREQIEKGIYEAVGENATEFNVDISTRKFMADSPTYMWLPKRMFDVIPDQESDYNLPEIMAGTFLTLGECPEFADSTIEDFYDMVEIPMEARTDFATAALIKQALELLQGMI